MASTSLCMVFLLAGDQQQREGVLPRVNNFGRAFHPCGRCRESSTAEVGRSSSRFEIDRPSMIIVNSSTCRQTRDRGPLRRERAGAPTQRDVQCSASDCCVLREQRQCYVYWRDKDGSPHGVNGVVPVNFSAIGYGLCDEPSRRAAILDRMEGLMRKEQGKGEQRD